MLSSGALLVKNTIFGYVQFFIPNEGNNIYTRRYNTFQNKNEWTNWIELINSGGGQKINGDLMINKKIKRISNDSQIFILSGHDLYSGGFFMSNGNNFTDDPGVSTIVAATSTSNWSALALFPNGNLIQNFSGTINKYSLSDAAIVAKSLNNNGYVSYASGLILQWGMITPGSNTSSFGVTLPISFTTVGAYALTAISQDGLSNLRYNPTNINTGIFYFTNSSSNNRVIKFIAIGH